MTTSNPSDPPARWAPTPAPSPSPAAPGRLWTVLGGIGRYLRSVSTAAVFALFGLWCLSGAPDSELLHDLDAKANDYYVDTMKQASAVYLLSAGVNAVTSVIKDSTISVTPFGIGAELSIGEFLDPIDDANEQLSELLTYVMIGLSALRMGHWILAEVGMEWVGWLLLASAACGLIGFWSVPQRVHQALGRIALFMLAARLVLPGAAIVSTHLDVRFFTPKLEAARAPLLQLSKLDAGMHPQPIPQLPANLSDGNWAGYPKRLLDALVVRPWTQLKHKLRQVNNTWRHIRDHHQTYLESLLQISVLHASRFLLNVIALPLLMLMGFSRLLNALFDLDANAPALAKLIRDPRALSGRPPDPEPDPVPAPAVDPEARLAALRAAASRPAMATAGGPSLSPAADLDDFVAPARRPSSTAPPDDFEVTDTGSLGPHV